MEAWPQQNGGEEVWPQQNGDAEAWPLPSGVGAWPRQIDVVMRLQLVLWWEGWEDWGGAMGKENQ